MNIPPSTRSRSRTTGQVLEDLDVRPKNYATRHKQ